MNKKIWAGVLFFTFFYTSQVCGEEFSLVNLGVVKGGLPSIESRFDRELGIRLLSIDGLVETDGDMSAKIKKDSDFDNEPTLTPKLVASLRNHNEDRSLVVWVVLDGLKITPKRKWLVGAVAEAKLTAKLYMYSLYFGEYLYSNEIIEIATVTKDPVFFRPVKTVTHITATERADLSKQLVGKCLDVIEDVVASVVKSELKKMGDGISTTVKKERAPSVSDMFNIPAMDAKDVKK